MDLQLEKKLGEKRSLNTESLLVPLAEICSLALEEHEIDLKPLSSS